MNKIYMAIAAAALTGLTACSTDELGNLFRSDDSERISFTATTDHDGAATRGIVSESEGTAFEGTQAGRPLMLSTTVTGRASGTTRGLRFGDKEGDKLDSFRVSAIKTADEVSEEIFAQATPDFFYNLKATKNTNNVFDITQDYYWPASSEKLWFYAYAPGDTTGIEVSSQATGGAQKVTFTVDADVTKQIDLMTANAATQGFNSVSGSSKKASVPLAFRHELCAIRFVIGEQWLAGSIKSIAIKGVHGKGTLTIGGGWEWKDKGGNAVTTLNDYSLTVNKGGLAGTSGEQFMDATNGQNIDFSDHYFLMIPQSFDDNDDAVIEVKYQDGEAEYTVTAPLKGQDAWVRNTTVTYAISSHALTTLKIGTIVWPVTNETQTWAGPKTAFAVGDSIGLYVVGTESGAIPIYRRNIKCTYNGNDSWTIHHPDGHPVYKLPGYQYFFYYPYTPEPNQTYPVSGSSTSVTASTFFSTLVNGWTPAAVQSDEGVFKKQDLQIGKGEDVNGIPSKVNVVMAHQMNIGIITLGTTPSLPNDVTYQLDANYQWHHGSDGTYTSNVVASSSFSGDNRPYIIPNTTGVYYYVFKPVPDLQTAGTELKANNDTGVDWSYELQSTDRGVKVEQTVNTNRTSFPVTKNYTLATGDVLYSDGALSRNTASTLYSNRTAIALVFATSTSSTDYTTYGWKHGYAISIRRAAGPVAFALTTTQCVLNSTAVAPTDAIADKDGYKHCKDVQDYASSNNEALTSYPAINACLNYSARNKDNTADVSLSDAISSSKWFLPSTGQWVDVFKNLGNYNKNPDVLDDRLYFAHGSTAVQTCTNAKAAFDAKIAILSDAGYAGLSVLKADDHSGYWTSTQRNATLTYEIYFMSYCDVYPYNKTHASGGDTWYARPCIAF